LLVANGGIAGDDICIIEKFDHTVDVQGIDNHQITNIPIMTAGEVVKTQQRPAIVILTSMHKFWAIKSYSFFRST